MLFCFPRTLDTLKISNHASILYHFLGARHITHWEREREREREKERERERVTIEKTLPIQLLRWRPRFIHIIEHKNKDQDSKNNSKTTPFSF